MNIHEHDKSKEIAISLDSFDRALLKDALFRYLNTYAMMSPVSENREDLSRKPETYKSALHIDALLQQAKPDTRGVSIITIEESCAMSLLQIAQYTERCTLPDLAQTKNPEKCDQIRAIGNFCLELADKVFEYFDNQNLNQLVPTINE